jgi:AcrR family transcriptional regulator
MSQRAGSRLRNAPTGHKGQGTVDRIIDATADLLEARGYEALTTNHIAEAADVNIATVYKYFANKQAILAALHERVSRRWTQALTHLVDQIRDGKPWRETVHQIIDVAAERRNRATGGGAIRIAMRVSPELQAYDRAESIESAQFVAELLMARSAIDAATATRVGRVAIEVAMAVLDLLLQEGAADEAAWVGEAKAVVCNYLAPYFEASNGL